MRNLCLGRDWSRSATSAIVLLLAIHAGLLVWSAIVHSPNANEPSHLAAGLSHWQLGRYELYRVNPPLVRMVAALPVLALNPTTDWSKIDDSPRLRPEFRFGPDFIAANGEQSLYFTTLARCACVPFSLIGGLVCLRWSRALYGQRAALLAITMWCFCPEVLGHASCFTPDAHAAAVGLGANFLFWQWLKHPALGRAVAAGVTLGLALLTKTTWLVLLGLWPSVWIAWWLSSYGEGSETRITLGRQLSLLVIIAIVGLHVLNTGYLYDGTFRRLGDYNFISRALTGHDDDSEGNRFRGTVLSGIPVPLPAQLMIGADVQKHEFELHRVSYLHGKTYRHGFWYFYLYAMAVKLPLGYWLLAGAAGLFRLTNHEKTCRARDELVLLAPFIAILTLVSSETDYTTHFRYVLPILPFGFIWISKIGEAVCKKSLWTPIVYLSMAWSVGSSLWFSPHWLSYFNESVGGPLHGHEHLANSNLDWGQDLLYLRDWLGRHPEVHPIGLAYYGMFHPRSIGIEFTDVPGWIVEPEEVAERTAAIDPLNIGPHPGWYAVSANFVVGHPSWNYRANGSRGYFNRAYFTWLGKLQPVDRAGYSIQIFHVTDEDVDRLREMSF